MEISGETMYTKKKSGRQNSGALADRRINSSKILQVATFLVLVNSVLTSPWNSFGFLSFL